MEYNTENLKCAMCLSVFPDKEQMGTDIWISSSSLHYIDECDSRNFSRQTSPVPCLNLLKR